MNRLSLTHSAQACLPESAGASTSPSSTPYTVRSGDTLSALATRLQRQGVAGTQGELLQQLLALNPQITDPDRIRQGSTLQLPTVPGSPAARPQESGTNRLEQYVSRAPAAPTSRGAGELSCQQPTLTAGALAWLGGSAQAQAPVFKRTSGAAFPTSLDGTPMYSQNDAEWGRSHLGSGQQPRTIGSRGCAMTSVAMALSKVSGQALTPALLDGFLDTHQGYVGNAIKWATAGQAAQPPVDVRKATDGSLAAIDAQLEAGRPVVLGVDYKAGSSGGTLGTDHWVCLTRRDPQDKSLYYANDPATGGELRLRRQPDGTLRQEASAGAKGYRSSGEYVTFTPASGA